MFFLANFALRFQISMPGPIFYILTEFLLLLLGTPSSSLSGTVRSGQMVQKSTIPDSLVKHIYLSFDDGPMPGTSNCITICEKQKVAATFFQVAFHQSRNSYGQNLYNRISKNGDLFLIANHSYSHAFYGDYLEYYHHADAALEDFIKADRILQTGNTIARLPGNNAWNTEVAKRASGLVRPLVKKMDSVGYNVIGWDMEWHFNKLGKPVDSPEAIASLADSLLLKNKTKTKNHLVILMHDHMFRTSTDSLKLSTMIQMLKQHPEYQFEKLTSYPGQKQ
jgi:peptidoglycan/xylan/chitin deacetylase (PgdA/CDA1 family)